MPHLALQKQHSGYGMKPSDLAEVTDLGSRGSSIISVEVPHWPDPLAIPDASFDRKWHDRSREAIWSVPSAKQTKAGVSLQPFSRRS